MFAFISGLVSIGVCIHIQYIFDMVRSKLQIVSTRVNQKKIKSRRMLCKCALNFDQCKTFFKNYKPMSLIMACLHIYWEQLSLATPSSFKLRRGIQPLLTK